MAEVSDSNLFQITNTGIRQFEGACVVIIRTEWNASIVDALESGCRNTLEKYGVKSIRTIVVPGAFEIIFGIKNYWDEHKYKDDRPCVFIALGCVIQGGTPHFEYISRAVTDGVVQLNLSLPVATIFGVLTVNNMEQALERVGGVHGHKGEEAAITALKMIKPSAVVK
jgi:6,7-dimethyl-8-ribityllumazine synthase